MFLFSFEIGVFSHPLFLARHTFAHNPSAATAAADQKHHQESSQTDARLLAVSSQNTISLYTTTRSNIFTCFLSRQCEILTVKSYMHWFSVKKVSRESANPADWLTIALRSREKTVSFRVPTGEHCVRRVWIVRLQALSGGQWLNQPGGIYDPISQNVICLYVWSVIDDLLVNTSAVLAVAVYLCNWRT